MKNAILVLFGAVAVLGAVSAAEQPLKCEVAPVRDMPKTWLDMTKGCVGQMRRQIQKEIDASMIYLAMGAHFSKDTVNRPGFAEFFFKAAAEEREHGLKLIEYLLMRGKLSGEAGDTVSGLINLEIPTKTQWTNGLEALKDALRKEAEVTNSIRQVIELCEDDAKFNDYHLVDYLTGVYLEEQYEGQRELAGKISTLGKMMESHGDIGEFLFDKKF